MKSIFASAVVMLAASSASAADLAARTYTKAPAYASVYDWTGFYLGGHVGGAFVRNDNLTGGAVPDTSSIVGETSSFLGGGQLGANYQFASRWLVGIEGQISALSGGSRSYLNTTDTDYRFTLKSDWLASVTGRLGYAWGPALLYAKGGAAFRDNGNLAIAESGGVVTAIGHREDTGYTVGGGIEYMFAPSWSAALEYQYYNFGRTSVFDTAGLFSVGGGVRVDEAVHTVKAGINYHFNWGGPVVAKY